MRKILVAVLAVICLGCTSLDVRKSLEDVESYIMERPDSALAVLDSMDRSLLSSDRTKAHHALLYAMALDKNFIDVSDDSIARVAVDYYSRRGSAPHHARSLYYLGIAYFYQGAYDKAILELTKAEEVARECDSLYWGMTKNFQANIHNVTYNEAEEQNCLHKAQEIYLALGNVKKVQSITYKLAKLYTAKFQYIIAEDYFKQLLEQPITESAFKYDVLRSYAFMKISQSNLWADQCVELYNQVIDFNDGELMTYQDYWAYLYALNIDGVNVSDDICDLAKIDTTISAPYWQYRISKQNGDYHSALDFLEITGQETNDIVTETLNQSLLSVQRDYFESQAIIRLLKMRASKNYVIIVSLLTILIVGGFLILFTRFRKRKNEEKERYLQYAEEVRRQLEDAKNESYPLLKRKYIDLYKTRFETIGALYEQYSLSFGKDNAEHLIYEKVVTMVDEFRKEFSDTAEFEAMLDADLDNIMTHLRNEIPKLKQADVTMFCFMALGFDVTTISHLMNVSMNTVYIRKSRLRQKVESAHPEHLELFLHFFGEPHLS